MKKVLFLIISLFLFCNIVYADPLNCYIGKDSDENVILKSGDEVKVYFKSTFSHSPLVSSKYQLYYDPYVFDLVNNEDEFVFYDEGITIKNVKKYSSLIEFEAYNNDNGVLMFPSMYVKLKVKDNVKNGDTIVELINNDSYVKQLISSMVDDEEVSEETECNVLNSKLYYKIDNNSEEFKKDNYLTFIDVTDDGVYMSPGFTPNNYEYNVYLSEKMDDLYFTAVCAAEGCGVDDYSIKNVNKNMTFNISTVGENSVSYKMNIIFLKDNDYYDYPTLKNLKVLKYDTLEDFDEYTQTYHVVVPDTENSLLIDYESDFDVEIIGNENFQIGENVVTINVKSKNVSSKYYIVVQKQEKEVIKEKEEIDKKEQKEVKEETKVENNKKSNELNIIIGLILVVTLILITVFIVKNRDNNNIKE